MGPAPMGDSGKVREFSRAMIRAFMGMNLLSEARMAPTNPTSSARVKRIRTSPAALDLRNSSMAASAAAAAARSSQAGV